MNIKDCVNTANVPVLNRTVIKLLSLVDSSIDEILFILEKDPVLTFDFLNWLKTTPNYHYITVRNLRQGLTIVGEKQIRSVLIALALKRSVDNLPKDLQEKSENLINDYTSICSGLRYLLLLSNQTFIDEHIITCLLTCVAHLITMYCEYTYSIKIDPIECVNEIIKINQLNHLQPFIQSEYLETVTNVFYGKECNLQTEQVELLKKHMMSIQFFTSIQS